MNKGQNQAVYFSEERITKMKQADEEFREDMKKDEQRIIARYLAGRIIRFEDKDENENSNMSKLQ